MEAWAAAESAKISVDRTPPCTRSSKLAVSTGFFSIWMTVFAGDIDMRTRLIDAFSGTRDSGCFDDKTTAPVCPAPNLDGLLHGGKT
jgi:hypothetical protein